MGCLAYADNMVLMTENKGDMESQVKIVTEYGKKWKIKFSAHMCKVMEFNKRKQPMGPGKWCAGGVREVYISGAGDRQRWDRWGKVKKG